MKNRINLLIIMVLFIFSGCAYYIALSKDTSRYAHNRIKKQVQKGLVIAAEDYSRPDKCKRYFYRDLLSLGYIPIYLCIDNKGDYEFIIRKRNIIFRFEDGTQAKAVDVKEVITNAQKSHAVALLAFPFGILPTFFIWGSITTANDKLDQDYSEKAFRDCYVEKGDSIFGFLFFKVPPKKSNPSLKDATLEIKVIKKANKEKKEEAETLKFIVSIDTD